MADNIGLRGVALGLARRGIESRSGEDRGTALSVVKNKEERLENVAKLEKKLADSTRNLEMAEIALEKARKRSRAELKKRGEVSEKTTKAIDKQVKKMEELNRTINLQERELQQVNRTWKSLAFDTLKNKYATAGTAMALFVKTLHNLSRTSSMAATSMLDLAQVPDSFGDAVLKVGERTVKFEGELHSLRKEALALGYSVDEANEYFKTAQKEMRLTDIGETRQATEDAMLFARVMRIDVGRALQYTTARVNKFGGSSRQATEDLAAITQTVIETNKGLSGTNLHMDKFAETVLSAAENSTFYTMNVRSLANITAQVSKRAREGGASFDQMNKAATGVADLLANPDDWVKYDVGKRLLGDLVGLDDAGLKAQLQDRFGVVSEEMQTQIADVLQKVRSGEMADVYGQQIIQQLLGGTAEGQREVIETYKKYISGPQGLAMLIEKFNGDTAAAYQAQQALLGDTDKLIGEVTGEQDKAGTGFVEKLKETVPVLANAEQGATAILNRLQGLLQNPLYTAIGALASGAMSVGVLIMEMRRLGRTIQTSVGAAGGMGGLGGAGAPIGGAGARAPRTFGKRFRGLRGRGVGRLGALTGAARLGMRGLFRGGAGRGLMQGAGGLLRGAGRALPFLGTAAMLGMDIANIAGAETPEARRAATGGAVGGTAGALAGGALGSLIPIPVVGTALGAAIGGWLGGKGGREIASRWDKLSEMSADDMAKTIETKMSDFGEWLADKAAPAFWSVAEKIPGIVKKMFEIGWKVQYGLAKGIFNTYRNLITSGVSFLWEKLSNLGSSVAEWFMEKAATAWDFVGGMGQKAMDMYDEIKKSILGTTYEMIAGMPVIGKRFAGSEFGKAWKEEVYGPKTADGGAAASVPGGRVDGKMGVMQPSGKVTLEIDAGQLYSSAGGYAASMAK